MMNPITPIINPRLKERVRATTIVSSTVGVSVALTTASVKRDGLSDGK